MKKGILVVTLILLLISLITADSDSSSTLEWKMFGRNLNNTRFYPDTVNITNMGVLWNFTTNGSINSMSSAIADDVLYIGSRDKKIYALNATTGQHIWNYTTGDRIDSSPAVSQGVVRLHGHSGCHAHSRPRGWACLVLPRIGHGPQTAPVRSILPRPLPGELPLRAAHIQVQMSGPRSVELSPHGISSSQRDDHPQAAGPLG